MGLGGMVPCGSHNEQALDKYSQLLLFYSVCSRIPLVSLKWKIILTITSNNWQVSLTKSLKILGPVERTENAKIY